MEEELVSCCVPPGFRFHPTEEELVGYYLARKVASQSIDLDIIQEVDLYRMEPWDLLLRLDVDKTQKAQEWYFFSYKDRKYPSGTRTNRATAAGFWKATGRDKPVMSSSSSRCGGSSSKVIGMRKTLVFYRGRAPHGRKTDWIMHEYRLQSDHHAPPPEEGWVVCRAFQKPAPLLSSSPHQMNMISNLNHHMMMMMYPPHPSSPSTVRSSKDEFLYPAAGAAAGTHHNKTEHLTMGDAAQPQLAMIQAAQNQDAAAAIDWNFLDTLLSSTIHHDPSSSISMGPAPAN